MCDKRSFRFAKPEEIISIKKEVNWVTPPLTAHALYMLKRRQEKTVWFTDEKCEECGKDIFTDGKLVWCGENCIQDGKRTKDAKEGMGFISDLIR